MMHGGDTQWPLDSTLLLIPLMLMLPQCVCVVSLHGYLTICLTDVFHLVVFSFRLERHRGGLSDSGPVHAANQASPVCEGVYNS